MSKAKPAEIQVVDHPNHKQRTYANGESVFYDKDGVQLPCVVVSSHQTGGGAGAGITYTVQGDIKGAGYPGDQPTGPFKLVTENELSDR